MALGADRSAAVGDDDGSRWARTRPTTSTQFVHDLRDRSVTPHIAIDGHLSKTGKPRKTAVDGRTTRHAGYDISQRCRKRIEEVFGWIKSSAGLAKVKLRGRDRVDAAFTLALAAYNLIRLPKLLAGRHERAGQVACRRDAGLSTWPGRALHSVRRQTVASSPSIASPAPSMAAATAMLSSSHGTAATKWSLPAAMVGPRCRTTARSKAKSASKAATIFPSSRADQTTSSTAC